MIPEIPWPFTLTTVATALIIPVAVWQIVSRGADGAGLTSAARRRVKLGTALFLGGWALLALLLAPPPSSLIGQDPYTLTLLIPAFAVGGIGTALALIGAFPALRRSLARGLPAGAGGRAVLPGAGTAVRDPGGHGPAPRPLRPAGRLGRRRDRPGSPAGRPGPRSRDPECASRWASPGTLLGLLDLFVAVGMGTGMLPLLTGARLPAAAAMGVYPLILVPTFAVPVAVLLHLVALRRLRHTRRPVATPSRHYALS